ncbi:hypothetical protein BH23ACT4_BH23ACT4_15600 [soil metagenome]
MQFRVTESFAESYDGLDDEDAFSVDGVITRIIGEHDQAWARRNRVVGDEGDAWIVLGHSPRGEFKIYWTHLKEGVIVLLALLYA